MSSETVRQLSNNTARESLASLQVGRGAAALMVLLYHLSFTFNNAKYWGVDPLRNAFAFGYSGVEFFFVLSGFIIYFIHARDIGRPEKIRRYVIKRVVRIYPIYWLVILALLPVYFLIPTLGRGIEHDPVTIISSFTLIHFDALNPLTWTICSDEADHSFLAAAWTLFHEILFYAVFALAIRNRYIGNVVMIIWLLASAATMFLPDRSCPLYYFFSPLHLLFAMGILASWIIQRNKVLWPKSCALLGVSLFLGTGALDDAHTKWLSYDLAGMLYGMGSFLAILGFVTLERQGKIRITTIPRLLGDASYSIYLLHYPLLSLLTKVFIIVGARKIAYPILPFAAIFLITTTTGIIVHLLLEKPLIRKATRTLLGDADLQIMTRPSAPQA